MLDTVRIGHLVLISTVDVYPTPADVDEAAAIDYTATHAYGRHRRELEIFCQDRFATTIVRLPGLFGPVLRKNAIFDLLHDHEVERIHPDSAFQFYELNRLWSDVERVRAANLSVVNLSVEPTTMRDVAARAFARTLTPAPDVRTVRYDMRSRYAARFGGRDGYWYDAASTLDAIAAFVSGERRASHGATA